MFMTIDPAAAWSFRVVRMKDTQSIETDQFVERCERSPVLGIAHDVVTRRDQVTSVETDARERRTVQVVDDLRQMLESIAKRPALPCRVLEQHHRLPARSGFERNSDGVGNEAQRVLLGASRPRSGMDDDAKQSERMGTIEFVDERFDRQFAKGGIGRRQIDQIARMRNDRRNTRFIDALPEPSDLRTVQRLAAPLIRILGEDLQRLAAVHDRPVNRFGHSSGD
jgi:hypothetical protein